MFKVYIFAEMLKAKYGIETTEFSKDLDDALDYIHIEAYIDLVHKYLDRKWDEPYSIPHMLKMLIGTELDITNFPMNTVPIIFGDITISTLPNKFNLKKVTSNIIGEEYSKAVLYDDKFYTSGHAWWIGYKGESVGRELVLKTDKEGLRFSIPYDVSDLNIFTYCSILFSFWLIKSIKLIDISYRIMPKNRLCFDKPGQIGYLDKFKDMEIEVALKDNYIKSIRTKEHYSTLDEISLKKLMDIVENEL